VRSSYVADEGQTGCIRTRANVESETTTRETSRAVATVQERHKVNTKLSELRLIHEAVCCTTETVAANRKAQVLPSRYPCNLRGNDTAENLQPAVRRPERKRVGFHAA
jgi:hypothetical protein